MSIVVGALLAAALGEIRVERAGDVLAPDDADRALLIFNELLDALNAEDRAIYTRAFTTFILTPNLQPHTIGVAVNTPTLTIAIGRPKRILNANIILANNIRVSLGAPLDDDEWNAITAGAAAGQAVTITSSVPRCLNYGASWPNGEIRLWPVPSVAYGLELETETLLAQVAATDTFDLPFGYQQALRLTLAELCASSFGQTVSAETANAAKLARARIWGNNDVIPNLCTRDAGMPGGNGGGFNYLTGMVG